MFVHMCDRDRHREYVPNKWSGTNLTWNVSFVAFVCLWKKIQMVRESFVWILGLILLAPISLRRFCSQTVLAGPATTPWPAVPLSAYITYLWQQIKLFAVIWPAPRHTKQWTQPNRIEMVIFNCWWWLRRLSFILTIPWFTRLPVVSATRRTVNLSRGSCDHT